jgi:hypothetical protein
MLAKHACQSQAGNVIVFVGCVIASGTRASSCTGSHAEALLRLSFHRYTAVAALASRALAALPPVLSLTLAEAFVPAMTASVALLAPGKDPVGLPALEPAGPSSSSHATKGLALGREEQDALLGRQAERLAKDVQTATGAAGASVEAVVEGSAAAAAKDGVCTSDNKHVAMGGLMLFDSLRGHVQLLLHARPQMLAVLYMAAITMQSYILPVRTPHPCISSCDVPDFRASFHVMCHWR